MSNRPTQITDGLYDYVQRVSLREADVLKKLREETRALGDQARMQISPDQGQFMSLLVELLNAKSYLEIGTFTGYSALACAMTLPPDGKVVACDVSREWTDIAQRYWREAGVSGKIDLRLAPAAQTLQLLLSEGWSNGFDLAFIDADKTNYDAYYEYALKLVRPGGLILIDNVLWNGAVADPKAEDEDTAAIRKLNEKLHRDDRISLSLLTIADGLTLCRKRD